MTQLAVRSFLSWVFSITFAFVLMAAKAAATEVIKPICEMWERIETPTRADLWGVFYDPPITEAYKGTVKPALYVAVGTQGTILTSVDGKTWIARSSGTTEWLLGVTKGPLAGGNGWVVVGDKGTILTSPDGITWSPQVSGTSERLNGVARCFDPKCFLAVGEKGTLCSSTDGVHWSVSSTGGSEWLRGVTYWQWRRAFLVTGANGRCFLTTNGSSITDLGSTGKDIGTILDASPGYTNYFAGDGAVWTLVDNNPQIVLEDTSFFRGLAMPSYNANLDAIGGYYANFSAFGTQGALGLSPRAGINQWFSIRFPRPDNLLAANQNVACGQAGVVWLQVDPSSEQTRLNIEPSSTVPEFLYEGGSLVMGPDYHKQEGLSFQWYRDGKKIEGSTQPSFRIDSLSAANSGVYTCAISNADNLFLWHLKLPKPLPAPPSLLAITPQASVSDPSSSAIKTVFPEFTGPQIDQASLRLECQAKELIVSRLASDGSIDASSQRFSIPLAITKQSNNPSCYAHTDSDGKIWVAVRGPSTLGYDGYTLLLRLLPSFQYDASFSPILLGSNSSIYFRASCIYVEDLSISVFPAISMIAPVPSSDLFLRFHLDGTPDPSCRANLSGTQIIGRTLLQDGSMIVLRQYRYWAGIGSFPTRVNDYVPIFWPLPDQATSGNSLDVFPLGIVSRLERYTPDGSLDPDFRADLDITGTANSLQSLPDGSLLLVGNIIAVNGVQCGSPGNAASAVRIVPDRHASATRLVGISSRATTGPDSETLITGFILAGNTQRSIVVSGIGPGLATQDITSPLGSPVVTLYAGQKPRMNNDNWENFADQSTLRALRAKTGAFPLIQGVADASACSDIAPGAYTVLITSKTARNGVALAEVYDGSNTPSSYSDGRVIGFSSRGKVGMGENAMIAGFVIDGPNSKRVLIAGSGPALTKLGVQGALPAVKLSLYKQGRLLTVAHPGYQRKLMPVINYVMGQNHLASDSKDTALCVTLMPGAYTIVMTGETESDQGVGLIEVYEAP